MSFRLNASNVFLTYPQCDLDRDEVLKHLKTLECDKCVVASEYHKDGSPHLHAYIHFNKKRNIKSQNFFDIQGYHPNIQACRSIKAVAKYITKDGNYSVFGIEDIQCLLANSAVSNAISSCATLNYDWKAVAREDPESFFRHSSAIQKYCFAMRSKRLEPEYSRVNLIEKLSNLYDSETFSGNLLTILSWLVDNLDPEETRAFKQRQLFIWGPANQGKTTMILELQKYLRVYFPPSDEEFYDAFDDNDVDLVVFDEFKGQKKIQFMNQFLQGSPMTLRVKGGQYEKRSNPPCIILSNFPLESCYSKASQEGNLGFAALESRLLSVNVTDLECHRIATALHGQVLSSPSPSSVSCSQTSYSSPSC